MRSSPARPETLETTTQRAGRDEVRNFKRKRGAEPELGDVRQQFEFIGASSLGDVWHRQREDALNRGNGKRHGNADQSHSEQPRG